MKKFIIFLSTFAAAIFILPYSAWSCTTVRIGPERILQLLEKAIFIGKVEVVDIQRDPSHRYIYDAVLQPVQTYRGALDAPFKTKIVEGMCNKYAPYKGMVYEEIIYEEKGRVVLTAQWDILPESTWVGLRKEAKPSPLLEKKNKECSRRGGVLVTHPAYFVNVTDCHFVAKDAGKECSRQKECDGLCMAYYTSEDQTSSQPFLYQWSDVRYRLPALPGRCSPWKDMDGCYHPVNKGKIGEQKCKRIRFDE